MLFSPFPKIPQYRRDADVLHAVRSIVCLEKLDGTNTRILVPRGATGAGDVVVGGRTLLEHEPGFCQPVLRETFFAAPARGAALVAVSAALGGDVALYGETCGRGIQAQGFIYGPRPQFVLFAARVGGAWLSHGTPLVITTGADIVDRGRCSPAGADLDPAVARRPLVDDDAVADLAPRELPSLRSLAAALGVAMAPCLYEGPPDAARFDALLDQPSAHAVAGGARRGDAPQEGIVIWSDPLLLDGAGRPLVAKHKDPRRAEALDLDGADDDATAAGEPPASFARRVVQLERLRHARQHLEESGRWTDVDADERAARLARRVVQDVAREVAAYQTQLAHHGKAAVRAALEARVAELLPELC